MRTKYDVRKILAWAIIVFAAVLVVGLFSIAMGWAALFFFIGLALGGLLLWGLMWAVEELT